MAEQTQPTTRMVVTHFIVSDDVERSRRFYTEVLGGTVVFGPEPTNIALANTFIIINVGGGPTDDKPTVTLETPRDPDRVSSFLNIRVSDIHAVYAEWSARGAQFLTPPKQHRYEIRCYIRDPDGYIIEVGQTRTHRETGGLPTGHRSTPAGNPTEPRGAAIDPASAPVKGVMGHGSRTPHGALVVAVVLESVAAAELAAGRIAGGEIRPHQVRFIVLRRVVDVVELEDVTNLVRRNRLDVQRACCAGRRPFVRGVESGVGLERDALLVVPREGAGERHVAVLVVLEATPAHDALAVVLHGVIRRRALIGRRRGRLGLGPQGTYEGQNAEGGAIFINTKAPSFAGLEGYARVNFGTYAEREEEAAVNLPLANNLAFRLSAQNETRDSYTTNLGPFGGTVTAPLETNQPGNLNRVLGRAQMLYEPVDGLDIRLIYQYSDRTTDGFPYIVNTPAGLANPRTISYDFPETYNVKYQRTTGIVDWKINDDVKLHIVSGYQTTDQYIASDTDLTSPYVSPTTPQGTNTIQIHDWYSTNEADLISTSSSAFQWTAGVTELDYHQPFTLQSTSYNPPGTTLDPNSGLVLDFHTFRKNVAAFAEVSYKFSPQWDIKVGGRYNYDHTGIQGGSFLIPPLPAPLGGPLGTVVVPVGPNEPTYHAAHGQVVLDFQPDEHNLIYATLSRGYKPGGWTPDIGGPPNPTNVYKAEYVVNTELGWKSTLLDSHLRTALDVFHMNFQNYQATVATDPNNPATSVTTNVEGTRINGLEAQGQALIGALNARSEPGVAGCEVWKSRHFRDPGNHRPRQSRRPAAHQSQRQAGGLRAEGVWQFGRFIQHQRRCRHARSATRLVLSGPASGRASSRRPGSKFRREIA